MGEPMSVRLLDLITCTCAVSAPDPVHDVMLHYLRPYLVAALDQPDVVLAIRCDATGVARSRQVLAARPPTATRTSHPQQRYHAWTAGDHEVLLPEYTPNHVITTTNDRIVLTAEHPTVATTVGTRIIRQLIMRGGEVIGGRCVHAGAVDVDGKGVLIGGHPGAGKTSVLNHLIERHNARPIANDRTVLMPVIDGSWQAVGVPLAWRFTPEGIGGSSTLSTALADRELSRGCRLVDGKMELTPAEISDVFDRPTLPATRLTQIVILIRSTDPPADTPAGSFVRRHLDFGAADFFAQDWLDVRPFLADHRDQSPTGSEDWWHKLALTMPIRVFSWTDPAELPILAATIADGAWT